MIRQPDAAPGLRRSAPLRLIVVAVALVASGCGGDSEGSDTTLAGVPGELGFGLREYGLTDEEWTIAVESVQQEIASCMAAAGFEYIPADVDAVELAMSAVRTEPGVSREDYKQQWGYGVTTRFDNLPREIELGERNLAIFAGLSEADQVAYERTLYGENPDATFSFQFDEEDFEPTGGCTRQAIEASFDEETLDPDFENPKDLLLDQDGRIEEAELRWADCMGEVGFDYEDQEEIVEEFGERLDELLDGDEPEDLPPARAEELAELQQEEIAISLVDLECQILHVDDVERQVEIELFGRALG